ncbi:MAG: YbgC/FadM family acyl-CoA thioesterase, partial [Pseudomonadota bacterium]
MTHIFPIRVYYEDTDMGGVVYHANYLRFIERARSDWVRNLGNDQNAMREAGIVWVVRRIEADYLAAARFDDALSVETTLASLTGA